MIATYTFRGIIVCTYDSSKNHPLIIHEEAEQCDFIPDDLFVLSKFFHSCFLHTQNSISDDKLESIVVN